jgi:hypothetical protein
LASVHSYMKLPMGYIWRLNIFFRNTKGRLCFSTEEGFIGCIGM